MLFSMAGWITLDSCRGNMHRKEIKACFQWDSNLNQPQVPPVRHPELGKRLAACWDRCGTWGNLGWKYATGAFPKVRVGGSGEPRNLTVLGFWGLRISWKRQIWWYSLVLPRGGYTWVCSVRDWVELWISEGGPGWSGHVLRTRRTYILLTNDSMPFWFGKWASCETIGTWRLHPS